MQKFCNEIQRAGFFPSFCNAVTAMPLLQILGVKLAIPIAK